MKLENILSQYTIEESITALLIASMYDDGLYESELLTEASVKDFIQKLGLKIHKGKGLIDYIRSFTQGVGRIIIAALKNDKETVRKLATSIKKEDVIDFLLKLDMATLHLVTGPIHFIDAVTGWELWANIKSMASKADSVWEDLVSTVKTLKSKVMTYLDPPKKNQIIPYIDNIESALGIT